MLKTNKAYQRKNTMKKLLLLMTCLLSGLMAADLSALDGGNSDANSRGAFYALVDTFNETAAQKDSVYKVIVLHAKAFMEENNLNAFDEVRNLIKARGQEMDLTLKLSRLRQEQINRLNAIREHPEFFKTPAAFRVAFLQNLNLLDQKSL